MAPPEGDAGTGMVSTNSVRKRTGNISVGTSAFSMNVLDRPLQASMKILTSSRRLTGLLSHVHTNNCSSDINAWVDLFGQFAAATGLAIGPDKLYERCSTWPERPTKMQADWSTTAICRAKT